MQTGLREGILASLVATMLLTGASSAQADYLSDAGMGVLTAGSNVLYMPAKLGYAVLGGVTGGLAYVLTGANYRVAEDIWTPSLGGDYVLTVDHLQGQKFIYFSGPPASSGWQSTYP